MPALVINPAFGQPPRPFAVLLTHLPPGSAGDPPASADAKPVGALMLGEDRRQDLRHVILWRSLLPSPRNGCTRRTS